MSFWSMAAGEEPNRGLFILVWMMGSVVFFAWPMHLYERARAVRRQRKIMRERIGDLDYEPSLLPIFARRSSGPRDGRTAKDELQIKAPDIDRRRFRKLLSGGRTAEQRMADYLKSLELKAEMQRATETKTKNEKSAFPPD
jgi:hypothetical protein